ncbi:MAG TPA: YraN family protein [Clostridiales bacterium]|nr:YraN family protein [Clostridiales bacterium]HOL90753.1 YraN family protein [Clostridiales bacterium]HPP36036.1 YraN family protein [Clostridiales bacterium]
MNRRQLGKTGEQIAADYLSQNGYTILEKNFRSGRFGEIDIIAEEGSCICFIEVKTRTSDLFGAPSEAVDRNKRQKIRSLALIYLKQKRMGEREIRFDVVEIIARNIKGEIVPEKINLIRGAF